MLQQLHGPNRSPPPPCRFPDCKCTRDLASSPYRIDILNRTAKSATNNTYCFKLSTVPCRVDNPCCTTQLYKVELPVCEYYRAAHA